MIQDEERGPLHALLIVMKDGPEWFVRLAELILLTAAFKLAATNSDNRLLDGFSWTLYFFTLMHAARPITSLVIGPHFRFHKHEIYQRRTFALVGGFVTIGGFKVIQGLIDASVKVFVAAGF